LYRIAGNQFPAHGLMGINLERSRTVKTQIVLAAVLVTGFAATPALADYYIVQEPTTKRCTIVEQRPTNPGIGVVIGDVFSARVAAEDRMKTTEVCHETTGRGGDTVIKEERRVR
jgi:hypothetical protein